jgi:X-Pro dipeptidyl-peptidase
MIFSSDRDFTLWPDPGTELTVDLNTTSLTLPVVGGEAAWQKAVPAR